MYAQLSYNPQDPDGTPWTVSYFMCGSLSAPVLTNAQAVQRGQALGQVRARARNLTDAQLDALKRVALALPVEGGDPVSGLFFALAHWQLPDDRRRAREDRIAATLQAYDDGSPWPALASGIEHTRCVAALVPDPFLEPYVASQVARQQMRAMKEAAAAARCGAFLAAVDQCSAAFKFEIGSPEKVSVLTASFTRRLSERSRFLDLLGACGPAGLAEAVRRTVAALQKVPLLPVLQGDVIEAVLQDCMAAGLDGSKTADIDMFVAERMAQARADDVARAQIVLDLTLDAMRAGVDLGPLVQPHNLDAIARADRVWQQPLLRMTPQRLRLLRKLDARRAAQNPVQNPARPAAASPAEPPDLDPVHAWSVARLVQWIGGRVGEAAPPRLDRAAIVVREKALRRTARSQARPAAGALGADQDLTEADVALAVQAGLCTTAGFLAGDIEDMRYRAGLLGVDAPALAASEAVLQPLRQLVAADSFDEQEARRLLFQAEACADQLRQLVRVGEQDARLRQRFALQLAAALARETLEEGKRRGGEIRCPLDRADWPWVYGSYHRRWLPWARQIVVDGVAQPLRTDQALALHVTGRSLSGYEFDVSVHLWLRKPDRTSPPALGTGPYAPMNMDDWTDTWVPCAVLHVPGTG